MRILSLILMLALVVLIVGCSEPQTADQTDTQDTTIQEPVDEQFDKIDTDVELGELEYLDKELEELDC